LPGPGSEHRIVLNGLAGEFFGGSFFCGGVFVVAGPRGVEELGVTWTVKRSPEAVALGFVGVEGAPEQDNVQARTKDRKMMWLFMVKIAPEQLVAPSFVYTSLSWLEKQRRKCIEIRKALLDLWRVARLPVARALTLSSREWRWT